MRRRGRQSKGNAVMLTLRDVRKEYGEGESAVVALKGVTVSFRENEFVSILCVTL